MTKTNMDLSELLAKHDQGDFLRNFAEAAMQLIMETDVEGLIDAGRHKRSGGRTTWRTVSRKCALTIRSGTLNLAGAEAAEFASPSWRPEDRERQALSP